MSNVVIALHSLHFPAYPKTLLPLYRYRCLAVYRVRLNWWLASFSTEMVEYVPAEKERSCQALHEVSFSILTLRVSTHLGSRSTDRLLDRGFFARLSRLSSTKSSNDCSLIPS